MSAIRFEHVSKSFDQNTILQDFSMDVQRAETKVILGGSGSGKTTILKMVLGLIKPDSGRVYVEKQNITDLSEEKLRWIRKKIGMVFQEGALFDALSVGENVAYRMRESGIQNHREIQHKVRELLGFVGLKDAINKLPTELSGGMQRRVGIARALVGNPPILLYDSPTGGLDPITSRTICELVMKLRDLEGVSSIFVTHDLKSAMILATEFAELQANGTVVFKHKNQNHHLINTRFLMLKNGRVLFDGDADALKSTKIEYIREFLI